MSAEISLVPVLGCLVKKNIENDAFLLGQVIKSDNTDLHKVMVRWVSNGKHSLEDTKHLLCGFSAGSYVKDKTPGIGRRSLGVGVVMQIDHLAGYERALIDFPEKGLRAWLPYQHLCFVRSTVQRYTAQKMQAFPEGMAERMRLRNLAHAIQAWNENTGSLSNLDIDPLPHQINLVHHILASGNLNWLIADDVGLGKTIETGMLLHALLHRGIIQRILLVTPAGLTKQWKEELFHKFGMDGFRIYGEDFHISEPREWKMYDFVIGSMDRLKQPNHLELLLSGEQWDLIVFDESHRLSRRQYGLKFDSSDRYDLAMKLRKKTANLLLLSATPHQGLDDKFIALLQLLRPQMAKKLSAFRLYPEVLKEMVFRNHKADVTDSEGEFIFKGKLTRTIRVPSCLQAQAFDEALQSYLSQGYAAGKALGQKGNAIGFVMTVYRKLAASSSAAIMQALNNRLDRLENDHKNLQQSTEELVDERYIGEWEEKLIASDEEFFQGERLLLLELIERAQELFIEDLKLQTFLDVLIEQVIGNNKEEKILVFTEYRTTQSYLKKALEQRFGEAKVSLINGSMSHMERSQAIAHFEDQGQFLVSTEAGGEGINLQRHCHIMVNYDLPWNPMRLVQRIGRLYRYGQTKKVVVFNIHQKNTLDEQIVDLMYQRIDSVAQALINVQAHEFNEGLKDEIIGQISEIVDIEHILNEATGEGVIRTEQRINEALMIAKEAAQKQREIFEYVATYDALKMKDELQVSREHLESFFLGMSALLNIEILERTHKGRCFHVSLPDTVKTAIGVPTTRASRASYTFDRLLAKNRSNMQVLDTKHPLMSYLIEKAKEIEFEGQCAPIQSNIFNSQYLATAILRWQDLQGQHIRHEFMAIEVGNNEIKINSPEFSQWLLKPASSGQEALDLQLTRSAFQQMKEKAERRLREISNEYIMPESLEWITAGWIN